MPGFFVVVVVKVYLFICKAEGERIDVPFSGSLANGCSSQALARPKPGAKNPIWATHVGGRNTVV